MPRARLAWQDSGRGRLCSLVRFDVLGKPSGAAPTVALLRKRRRPSAPLPLPRDNRRSWGILARRGAVSA